MSVNQSNAPKSVLDSQSPLMNFRMGAIPARRSTQGLTGLRRAELKRCFIGFVNVRTFRIKRVMRKQQLHTEGEWRMEHCRTLMRSNGLYALGMSEVRRDGSGEEDVGDGFTFVWQGKEDDGSRGGVAFLLSPEAAKAWRST